MKLIKSCKLWPLVLALTIVFAMGVVAFADDLEIDVYLTVERTLLGGQALILEPTKVTVPAGSDVLEVLQAAKNQDLLDFTYIVTGVGEYVRGFEVTSHGEFDPFTDYAYYDEFDAAAGGMGYIYFEYGTTPRDLFLTEGNYCMLGGWIISLNDEITWDDDSTPENEAMPTMTTIVEDNDVLRFQYSLALARDAGFEGWSLLTLEDLEPPFYERANKSELVRRMADHGTSDPAYAGEMSVLMDMEATQAEVNDVLGEGAGNLESLTWITNSGQITLRFGQVDEQYSAVHTGVDVQGSLGDDIRSAVNGQVVYTGYDTYYGNVVYINAICDGKNIQTRYAHLQNNTINVSVGQQVTAGYVIGKMGNTGGTTGGYLVELELLESTDGNSCRVDGTNARKVDPLPYFETVFSSDEYLSEQFAVSINHQGVGPLAIWPWEDENDIDVRYRENLDLDEEKGEVYLRKQVEKYAWEIKRIKKENLGSSNILVYNGSNNTVTVNLNGRSKTFAYNSYSVKNKNNRMAVRAEEFYSYFFIYPSYYNNPSNGAVVLLSHGYNSNIDEFKKTVSNMSDDNFINFGTIVGNGSSVNTEREDITDILRNLGISTTLSTTEVIKALVDRGKYVMIRTQFTDNKTSHTTQIAELQMFINWFIPSDANIILVGHSKGGLVSLGVAGDDSSGVQHIYNRILKTITVDTPYLASTLAEISALKQYMGFDNSPAIEDLAGHTPVRENIRNNWNQNGGLAYAIGVESRDDINSDYVVGIASQLGGDFNRINQRLFKPYMHYWWYNSWDYMHSNTPDRIEISREIKRICIGTTTEFK